MRHRWVSVTYKILILKNTSINDSILAEVAISKEKSARTKSSKGTLLFGEIFNPFFRAYPGNLKGKLGISFRRYSELLYRRPNLTENMFVIERIRYISTR